jgi:hypothetical protein
MTTYLMSLKRLQKREKRQRMKTKNRVKWLWSLIYSMTRKMKGIDNVSPFLNPTARKFAVLANRIYVRRNYNG